MRRAAPLSILSLILIFIAVGQTSIDLPQTASPTLASSTPSPTPLTTTTPQTANASPSTTRPSSIAPLSAQTSDTAATTSALSAGPTIAPQAADGTATTTQPDGAALVDAQSATTSSTSTQPEGAPDSLSGTWHTGAFEVDTDADGETETVHFVLSDPNSTSTYDTLDLSTDDGIFGNGTSTNLIADSNDDEQVSATGTVIGIGPFYSFSVDFAADGSTASITSSTWFTGELQADLNADGDVDDDADIVAYAVSDTSGDGLYDTVDLSTDDGSLSSTIFGENDGGGALSGQSPRQTGDDDDERLTGAGTSTSVRVEDHYTFDVAFDANPAAAGDSSDVTITAKTRFAGTFEFDVSADGALAADESETIKLSLFDTDSDGLYDLMDAGVGAGEGGVRSGSGTDGILSLNSFERMASGDIVKAGDTYHVDVEFEPNPPDVSDDAEIILTSKDDSPVAFTSLSSLTIDGDGDTLADDKVFFVLSDTNSDGVVDTMDISMGDTVFSEGEATDTDGNGVPDGLEDDFVDFTENDNANDERLTVSDVPANVQLGAHTFEVDFDTDIFVDTEDGRITSRWYTGHFSADLGDDGTTEELDFVLLDPDSDGLYTHFELDGDNSDGFDATEVHTSSPTTVSIGPAGEEAEAELVYSLNPVTPDSAALTTAVGEEVEDVAERAQDSILQQALDIIVESSETAVTDSESQLAETMSELQELEQLVEKLEIAGDEATAEGTREDLAATKRELAQVQEKAEQAKRANDIANGNVPQSAEPPSSGRVATDASGQRIVGDEVVIGLSEDTPDAGRRIREIASRLGGRVIGAVPEANTYQLQVRTPFLPLLDARIAGLQADDDLEFVVRHVLIDESLTRAPVTPEFDPWRRRPGGNNWNLEAINALDAWEFETGSARTKVGVIDVEFDNVHRDLRGNVGLVNGKLARGFGGHGTHVAGTICADGDNRVGVVGVSWNCTLNLYEFGGSSAVTALQAMIRAVAQGARVINVSLQWVENNQCGQEPTEATLRKVRETNDIFARAIRFARSSRRDVLWVFAAGNECRDARFASPASLGEKFPEDILVVGAVERDGRLASFSNFGSLVDVAAPGRGILSTLPRDCRSSCQERFGSKSGTSMATPHVSGLAALMLSANPRMSASEVRACIVATADQRVPGHSFRVIDAAGAMRCATDGRSAPTRTAPSPKETPSSAPPAAPPKRGGKVPCGLDPANPC